VGFLVGFMFFFKWAF